MSPTAVLNKSLLQFLPAGNTPKTEASGTMGHLHDGLILLLRTESFKFLLSGITKFKYESKNEIRSCLVSKQ